MSTTAELMIRGLLGTLFIDIDGTILNESTEDALPFAVQKINAAYDKGYMIVLTTMRGSGDVYEATAACSTTLQSLKDIELKFHFIIWNSPSPRTLINDEYAAAIKHPRNGSWEGYSF